MLSSIGRHAGNSARNRFVVRGYTITQQCKSRGFLKNLSISIVTIERKFVDITIVQRSL